VLAVFEGLLTVNPKGRLTMQDLRKNEWINGKNVEVLSTTPLATPDVLSLTRGSVNTIQSQITATLSAFHKAHRAGFRLQDVSNAPLMRRRKRKREECGSSGSTDSSRASTPIPPLTTVPSPLAVSKTMSPTLGVMSTGPGTGCFQPFSSVAQPTSCGGMHLPPLSVIVSSQPGSALRDLLQRDDSAMSRGFSPENSPATLFPGFLHSSAAESSVSRRSTPNQSPASRQPTDGSSSSRGSTPQRSPLSSTASVVSLGFFPATSAANSSENSSHDSERAATSQIQSSSSLSLPSSLSQSENSFAVTSCSDNLGCKRKLLDSFDDQSCNRNDDDGDDEVCIHESVISS